MSTVIAIAADKGGTGKTTTTYALSLVLARSGYNVVAVDLDPQANLTKAFLGKRGNDIENTLTTALRNGTALPFVDSDGVRVVPADIELSLIDEELDIPFGQALRKILSPAIADADFVLIDCPPGASNRYTFCALTIADYLLIPVTAADFCIDAIDNMLAVIKSIPSIKLLGVLLTQHRYNGGNIYHAMEQVMRGRYGNLVFKQTIRHSAKMLEKLAFHSSLMPKARPFFYLDDHEPERFKHTLQRDECSISELDYIALTEEILSKFNLHLNIKFYGQSR